MGPTIILDKSIFESLSGREISFLSKHYFVVTTPILIFEVLADLSKTRNRGKFGKPKVQEFAEKLLCLDGAINADYTNLCIGSLLGGHVPMTGQAILDGGIPLNTSTGEKITYFEEPYERQLMRNWSRGDFTINEEKFAEVWRKLKRQVDLDKFKRVFGEHAKSVPKFKSLHEVNEFIEKLITDTKPAVQFEHFSFMTEWFVVGVANKEELVRQIYNRWMRNDLPTISSFSPYSSYLFKVNRAFSVGLHSELITTEKSQAIDLLYLYYLPFCQVFASDDDFHKKIAPLFLRDDQEFVNGDVLKKDLKWLAEEWDSLTEDEKENRAYDYGSYPPPNADSITYHFWKKYMKPWKPGSGNKAIRMTKEEHDKAIQEMQPMAEAVEQYLKSQKREQQS